MQNHSPIRVAMLINGYYPRLGGAERILGAVCPFLHAEGVEVYVLTRRYDGLPRYEEVAGVPVHRLPIPGPKAVASMFYTLTALLLLRHLHPHIVHAHELFSTTTTALLAKQMAPAPIVVTAHRSGGPGDVRRLQQKLLGGVRMRLFREHIDAFITISREIDQELASAGIPDAHRHFIPNGVDTERFSPVEPVEKLTLRRSLCLPEGPIVVFSGRLAAEKRVNFLINIWPAVRAVHPDALLLLLGIGPEEQALKQAAGEGIYFAGCINDVVPYLQAADLFVLPSVAEGLSVALLEALSIGLPVVVTAVGGAPDVIEHGVNGVLIPPDDRDALQGHIIALLGDSERRGRLGAQGRERIFDEYGLAVMAQRLRALYDQLLQDSHTGTNHKNDMYHID